MYVFVIGELQGAVISGTLSSARGPLCGASERCSVPETLHLTKQDGFPANLSPDKLLWNPSEGGDSIKIINKEVRISPYFWCGSRHCDRRRPFTSKNVCYWAERVCEGKEHLAVGTFGTAQTVLLLIPLDLFTLECVWYTVTGHLLELALIHLIPFGVSAER